jgi:hypothetical protein
MKSKVTWKPAKLDGRHAKRWRAAGQTKGPANLLPEAHAMLPDAARVQGKQPRHAPNAT